MNPEKESNVIVEPALRKDGKVVCINCGAKVEDDSKHRGRFLRRHYRDNVCGNFALKQEEGRAKLAADLLAARIAEGAKDGGARVDMSGDAAVVGAVDGGTLQGGVE